VSILEEILQEMEKEFRLPDDITRRMVQEKLSIGRYKAEAILKKKVEEGRLMELKVFDRDTGKHVMVYREVT